MEITEMFSQIKQYQKHLGYNYSYRTKKGQFNHLRSLLLALSQEVAELTDSFPWKPWRKIKDQPYDIDNALREIVDIIFFLGGIMSCNNISSEEFIKKFEEVLDNNYKRIQNGYGTKQ